jgi:hypothetical protein
MITGGTAALTAWLAHYITADSANAAFEFVGGILIWMHTRRAWKDREIKGVSMWPFIFFWSWGIYNLWYYAHIGQPISGMIAFMPALANSAYIFSHWLFSGPFNYDKRSHRARWFFIRTGDKIGNFFGDAAVEVAELPSPLPRPRSNPYDHGKPPLPERYCPDCGFTRQHDLDDHCMVCDKINKGAENG